MEIERGDGMFGFHPSAQIRRQSCQLYAPAAYHLQGNSLVLIFLLEAERTPGLGNADRKNRNRDPYWGVVPQPTAPPLVPNRRMPGPILPLPQSSRRDIQRRRETQLWLYHQGFVLHFLFPGSSE
jgi:hypothetical protein